MATAAHLPPDIERITREYHTTLSHAPDGPDEEKPTDTAHQGERNAEQPQARREPRDPPARVATQEGSPGCPPTRRGRPTPSRHNVFLPALRGKSGQTRAGQARTGVTRP